MASISARPERRVAFLISVSSRGLLIRRRPSSDRRQVAELELREAAAQRLREQRPRATAPPSNGSAARSPTARIARSRLIAAPSAGLIGVKSARPLAARGAGEVLAQHVGAGHRVDAAQLPDLFGVLGREQLALGRFAAFVAMRQVERRARRCAVEQQVGVRHLDARARNRTRSTGGSACSRRGDGAPWSIAMPFEPIAL